MELLGKITVTWENRSIPHDGKVSLLKDTEHKVKWSGYIIGYRKNIWGRVIALLVRNDGCIIEEPMKNLKVKLSI